MKLCVLSITAVLASFVVANPILAPRAPSRSFRLSGDGRLGQLTILRVAEANHPDYFQLGWYGKGSEKIKLFFSQDQSSLGPVFDARQNGYEMVLQTVTEEETGFKYYRPLLIDRAKTALSGLQSPSRFYSRLNFFYSKPEGPEDNPYPERWMTCRRSETDDEKSTAFVADLIFAETVPEGCESARNQVELAMEYVSTAAVKLASHVHL